MQKNYLSLILISLLVISLQPSHAYSNKTKAGLGLSIAAAGTTVGAILAYHYYQKYNQINPETLNPELIKQRKRYLYFSIAYGIGGGLTLLGGSIYGINNLQEKTQPMPKDNIPNPPPAPNPPLSPSSSSSSIKLPGEILDKDEILKVLQAKPQQHKRKPSTSKRKQQEARETEKHEILKMYQQLSTEAPEPAPTIAGESLEPHLPAPYSSPREKFEQTLVIGLERELLRGGLNPETFNKQKFALACEIVARNKGDQTYLETHATEQRRFCGIFDTLAVTKHGAEKYKHKRENSGEQIEEEENPEKKDRSFRRPKKPGRSRKK